MYFAGLLQGVSRKRRVQRYYTGSQRDKEGTKMLQGATGKRRVQRRMQDIAQNMKGRALVLKNCRSLN